MIERIRASERGLIQLMVERAGSGLRLADAVDGFPMPDGLAGGWLGVGPEASLAFGPKPAIGFFSSSLVL